MTRAGKGERGQTSTFFVIPDGPKDRSGTQDRRTAPGRRLSALLYAGLRPG